MPANTDFQKGVKCPTCSRGFVPDKVATIERDTAEEILSRTDAVTPTVADKTEERSNGLFLTGGMCLLICIVALFIGFSEESRTALSAACAFASLAVSFFFFGLLTAILAELRHIRAALRKK